VTWISLLFALASGALITIQAGGNAQLKQSLNNPIGALIINYIVGLVAVILFALFLRVHLPDSTQIAAVPWWAWLGGAMGTAYGLAVVYLAHRLSAAILVAAVVMGQLVCAIIVDNFAWVGFAHHTASPLRVVGCGLMVAGFVLIAKF
jgi:transporter family-2 protein